MAAVSPFLTFAQRAPKFMPTCSVGGERKFAALGTNNREGESRRPWALSPRSIVRTKLSPTSSGAPMLMLAFTQVYHLDERSKMLSQTWEPRRQMNLLLDANSLVNAAFLERSWSRRAVDLARARKAQLLVSNVILDEARCTVRSATSGMIEQRDPWQAVETFCVAYAVATIFCGVHSSTSAIHRHDQHIELAARQVSAKTLTNDIELARALKKTELPACYPLELVSEYEPGSLRTRFFGERPTSNCGSLFFRGRPNGGSGQPDEILEPFSWPGFSVCYSYPAAEWRVIVNRKHIISAPHQLERGENLELGLSWTSSTMALRLGGNPHPFVENLASPIDVDFRQAFQLAAKYMGTIFLATMDNRTLGKGIWRKSLSDPPYSSPNPYDIDRAREAIRLFASSK